MYRPDPAASNPDAQNLKLLESASESASESPEEICENDPEVKLAFEEGLRELAEDIVKHHPSLAHLLIGMSDAPCPYVHGQN
jgi:hypothetical protein